MASSLYSQFKKPTGFIGRLAGYILAYRSSNRARNAWVVRLLDLKQTDHVLEIGCGPGVALRQCLKQIRQGHATGLDHSDVMISQSRARNARAVAQKRLRLICGTLNDLTAEARRFDKIFSVNLIQFEADKRAHLAACAGLLNSQGTLAVAFQPRGTAPSRQVALDMAQTLETAFRNLGLLNVRSEILDLKPIPAICTIGHST